VPCPRRLALRGSPHPRWTTWRRRCRLTRPA
jgi:hypothetical protein